MIQYKFGAFTIVVLSLLNFGKSASAFTLDKPTNSSNTIQEFTIKRKLSWTNQDFQIFAPNSTSPIMKVENHMANQFSGFFGLDINFPDGRFLDVKAQAGGELCGFKQIYEISNGVRFRIDPRGILSDQWEINKSGNVTQNYIWHRNVRRLAGPLVGEDKRKVAYFDAKTFGSRFWSGVFRIRLPGLSEYTIVSNGDVPIEDLVALFVTAIIRVDDCSW